MSDFFDSHAGLVDHGGRWRPRIMGRLRDAWHDLGMAALGGRRKARAIAARAPVRKVLVLGVAQASRAQDLDEIVAQLRLSRHEVTASIIDMQPGVGKFQNITRAIERVGRPISDFDWVVITDDDVGLPHDFLDHFIGLAEHAGLMIAQPAHRFFSYATFAITQRRWGSLVRTTRWVEIGPITALRRDAFGDLIPFPVSRWDWGLDVYWAQLAGQKGWRIGVVDGVPIEHRRPVAGSYDAQAAIREAVDFLARYKVTITRADCHGASQVVTDWWPEHATAAPRQRALIVHHKSSGAPP